MGIAYKADIDDVRESPAFDIMELLHKQGAQVSWYDPLVPSLEGAWAGGKLASWDVAALRGFDAAVIVTAHKSVDHSVLLAADIAVVDSRHALAGHDSPRLWQL